MLDKKSFEDMRRELEAFDKLREELIAESRLVLKSSKQAIYAAHRGDLNGAKKLLSQAKVNVEKMRSLVKKDFNLSQTGAYGDALEEYAEASCYISYIDSKSFPTAKDLKVDTDVFLGALSDTVGELVRKAVNSSASGDYKTSLEIKKAVEDLYAELMLFDWRNTPVRKKFDAIKYGLEKLEDLALKIKFRQ